MKNIFKSLLSIGFLASTIQSNVLILKNCAPGNIIITVDRKNFLLKPGETYNIFPQKTNDLFARAETSDQKQRIFFKNILKKAQENNASFCLEQTNSGASEGLKLTKLEIFPLTARQEAYELLGADETMSPHKILRVTPLESKGNTQAAYDKLAEKVKLLTERYKDHSRGQEVLENALDILRSAVRRIEQNF